MNTLLEQQNFPDASSAPAVFSSDPSGVKERPANEYYASGVSVGYTAPGKWWNWFWNHISAWLRDSKTDREAVQAELLNVLDAGSITPDANDNHQLSKAIDNTAYGVSVDYNDKTITEEIGGESVTHLKNQPYVIGNTLYIPDTELL
jgi:hypothetical protein